MEIKNTEITNNEKYHRPKMSAHRKKRLIAQMVLGVCAAGFITSFAVGLVYAGKTDNAMCNIREYEKEKQSILNTYRTSHEFQQEFKAEVQKSTDLYVNNLLSYEEYTDKLEYLNSQEFIENILYKGSKHELQNKINSINTQVDDLQQVYDKNSNISCNLIGGMIGSGIAGITPSVLLSGSLSKDNVY